MKREGASYAAEKKQNQELSTRQ